MNKKPHAFLQKLKAFTLIELIIVIVILGILVAVAIPKYKSMNFESKQASTFSSLSSLRSASNIFVAKQSDHSPPIIGLENDLCSKCNGGIDPDDNIQEVKFFPLFIPRVPQNEIFSEFVSNPANDSLVMVYTQSGILNSKSQWLGNSSCGISRSSTGKIDEGSGWVYAVEPYSGISGGGGEGYDWRINIQDCVKGGTMGYYEK